MLLPLVLDVTAVIRAVCKVKQFICEQQAVNSMAPGCERGGAVCVICTTCDSTAAVATQQMVTLSAWRSLSYELSSQVNAPDACCGVVSWSAAVCKVQSGLNLHKTKNPTCKLAA